MTRVVPRTNAVPAVVPISAEEEAWLIAQVDLVNRLAADEEPADAPVAPSGAPVVFLDLDDVVCRCDLFGGMDALECVTAKRTDVDYVYRHLFHPPAVEVLRRMHAQMGGRLRYVISSTWRQSFTRAQLRHVLGRAGLPFVADCMEDGPRWATPTFADHDRAREIWAWLGEHHQGEPFVVIDDTWSGASLPDAPAYPSRVVLCDESTCLEAKHLATLVGALRTPPQPHEAGRPADVPPQHR